MKLLRYTLPLSALVALGGLALMALKPTGGGSDERYINPLSTRHPVTPQMERVAREMARTPLPAFQEKLLGGGELSPADFKQGKPTVLIFIKKECPCSIEAQPIFNRMAAAFGASARFYGVIDADARDAGAYSEFNRMQFGLLLDTDMSMISSFKLKASASLALVDGDGQVVQVWPGYSQSVLRQLNYLLGTLAKTGPKEFDQSDAPEKLTAGCAFEFETSSK